MTENDYSKIKIMSFQYSTLEFHADNSIPKKSLDTSFSLNIEHQLKLKLACA